METQRVASPGAHRPFTPTSESSLHNTFPQSAHYSDYEVLENLGVGAYGHVYRAIHIATNEIVALKKFKMQNETEGFPICAIREIMLLSKLDHPNIVKLKEVVTSPPTEHNRLLGDVYLVFEYLEHNLGSLIEERKVRSFSYAQVKGYMKQILTGIFFCHSSKVLHRDIKPTNILLNRRGEVKIADFGLSRSYHDANREYTTCVVTRWYRAPELLFQIKKYTTAIDIWSIGCLFAELMTGVPIFPGPSDKEQLEIIFRTCGSPNERNWPTLMTMPEYEKHQANFSKTHRNNLQKNVSAKVELPGVDQHAYDLLDKLLALDPAKRPTASAALDSSFFWTDPMPLEPSELPSYPCDGHLIQKRFTAQKERTEHGRAPVRQTTAGPPVPPAACATRPPGQPQSHSHSHSHSHNHSHSHSQSSHASQPPPPPPPVPSARSSSHQTSTMTPSSTGQQSTPQNSARPHSTSAGPLLPAPRQHPQNQHPHQPSHHQHQVPSNHHSSSTTAQLPHSHQSNTTTSTPGLHTHRPFTQQHNPAQFQGSRNQPRDESDPKKMRS